MGNCIKDKKLYKRINELENEQFKLLQRIINDESLNKTNFAIINQSLNAQRLLYKELEEKYKSLYNSISNCENSNERILNKFEAMTDVMKNSIYEKKQMSRTNSFPPSEHKFENLFPTS